VPVVASVSAPSGLAVRLAREMVARIDELFAIDADARRQGMDFAGRHALRLEKSGPLLNQIRKQIEVARCNALPAGALARACNYTLTPWEKLTRFLEYPELELSNNLAENTAICSSSGLGAIIAAASGVAVTRMIQTWLPNIRSRLNAALISARWVKA